jgi:hypothetical protein
MMLSFRNAQEGAIIGRQGRQKPTAVQASCRYLVTHASWSGWANENARYFLNKSPACH